MGTLDMPRKERMTCSQARAETSMAIAPLCEGLPYHQARRLREDALLIASELTANALRHGGGITRFSACVRRHRLLLQVSDRTTHAPQPLPHDPALPGGFGWLMVQNLARSVTTQQHRGGKTITVVVDTIPPY
ncbi:ATP-binding protein [Streptomyces sp. NPDC056121]|uniref:ATP-binding protein n=1 Tax=Streptomyces TaxID=1883 RepID=UPI001D09B57F|nr:ATP-binding protein [Streptomyces longhuiensis]UDL97244.1 ATP-binding protein [Streptomyces longhuiensis]